MKTTRKSADTATSALLCGFLILLTTGAVLGAETPPPPPAPPRVPVNLITNSDFEIDADRDGVPDGWFHSQPQYWSGPAKNSALWNKLHELWVKKGAVPANIPFRSPDTLEGGTYKWEAPGYRSGHSISVDETTELKWGEWDTAVEGIKPKTDYVIMGWRKQSVLPGRKARATPWMKIAAFGRMVPVKGTIDRNAWVPFAVPVNSGGSEGECSIGFIAEPSATKVWIDKVAMFEGTMKDIARFRVGLKGALLEYPFHDTVYASPDIQCPFFFDVLWSFHNVNGDSELEIVVDLPEGLDLTWSERGMGVTLASRDPEPISIEGRPYVRRAFAVLSAKEHEEFDSGYRRVVRLWLKTQPRLKEGVFEAFYHARWQGGRQPDQPLGVRIIRVRKVQQPRMLVAGLGGLSSELVSSRANILARDLAAAGMNCVILDDGLDAKVAELFEKAGIAPAARFALGGAKLPDDAAAKDSKGNAAPVHLCPSYRPTDALKTVFAAPAALVKDGTTTLFTDLRNGRQDICFCERCVKGFEADFKQHNPDLKYVPPSTFEAEPDKFKKLHAAWHEFRAAKLADLYWTLRKSLDEFRRTAEPPTRNASDPLRFLAMVPTPSLGREAVKLGAMLDYTRIGGVFDFEVIEPRMNVADAGGTPRWVGDEVEALVKHLPPGGKAGAAITAGSCEERAAAPVVRRSDVRDQVLEAVVAGAKAVILRPFHAVDGMDIKQFSEALGMLLPFEEIIAEGEPLKLASVPEGKGAVRCLGRAGQMLLLVTDYSSAPAAEVKVALEFAKGAKRAAMILVDVESARVVAEVPADAKQVEVPLDGGRARLFYLGLREKLPIKLVEEK